MANPSLQIGNSNWAIKEDNLLGYSTAGTRFLPEPITMTRASAGTRVNSSGLVETVELLGSEEVTNGDFATDTDWVKEGTWTISNGTANRTAQASGFELKQTFSVFNSNTWKVSFEIISISNGGCGFRLNGGSVNTYYTEVGVYTETIIASGAASDVIIQANSTFAGSIDNVTVKESTKNNLARVDYDGTASSLLVEPQRTNLVTYSEDFSQYNLSGFVAPIESGYLAPDGTNSAYKVTGVIGSSSIYLPSVSSMTATKSIYARTVSGTGTTRLLSYYGNTNNTFTLTEEWQRFELTGSIVTGGNNFYAVDFRSLTTTLSELIIWGGQAEEASYATSYIPTSGSSVTRVQETYSKTGITNLINSEEGVLFLEMAALSNSGNYRLITLSDGTTSNRVFIGFRLDTGYIYYFVIVGGSTVASHITSTTSLDFSKVAVKWKANDFALWINGSEISTDTSGSSFTANTLNTLQMNEGDGSGFEFHGKVKQLQVFKTALTDTELATLTTI